VKSQQSLKLRISDYVFTFFEMPLQKKRKKSRFLDFQKKRKKNVFSNYAGYVDKQLELIRSNTQTTRLIINKPCRLRIGSKCDKKFVLRISIV